MLLLHFFNADGPLLRAEHTRHAYCSHGSTRLGAPEVVDHGENLLGVPANDEWGRVRRPHRPLGLRLRVRTPLPPQGDAVEEWKNGEAMFASQWKRKELPYMRSQDHATYETFFELDWNDFKSGVGRGWRALTCTQPLVVGGGGAAREDGRSRMFMLEKQGHEAFGGFRFGGLLLRAHV